MPQSTLLNLENQTIHPHSVFQSSHYTQHFYFLSPFILLFGNHFVKSISKRCDSSYYKWVCVLNKMNDQVYWLIKSTLIQISKLAFWKEKTQVSARKSSLIRVKTVRHFFLRWLLEAESKKKIAQLSFKQIWRLFLPSTRSACLAASQTSSLSVRQRYTNWSILSLAWNDNRGNPEVSTYCIIQYRQTSFYIHILYFTTINVALK